MNVRYTVFAVVALLFLAGIDSATVQDARTIALGSTKFDVRRARIGSDDVRIFWKKPDGTLFRNFDSLQGWLRQRDKTLGFATNGGIYTEERVPLGLFVENHRELHPSNLKNGYGNFYIKPNGIFIVRDDGYSILRTEDYHKDASIAFAIQSGPLLALSGEVNSAFSRSSNSKNIRNGVGLVSSREVVFVISREPVTFFEFADFFVKELKCSWALYLDGAISEMYLPELGRNDTGGDFATIIAIVGTGP